jgi:hypothetical protein
MERMVLHSWRRWTGRRAAAGVLAALLVGAEAAQAAPARGTSGETMYATTASNLLLTFDSRAPGRPRAVVRVSGLQRGERLLGIDVRPANGTLYGLGSTSRLYTIEPTSGVATPVGAEPFAIPLAGASFGFDFNPAVDRIRVVSDAGQNMRLHPDLGTVVDANPAMDGIQPDGPLTYDATTDDSDPVDINAGRTPGAVGAAYTNPDNDPATGTILYDLDVALDVLVIQAPPNNGVLNTVGGLGADVGPMAGFDIGRAGVAYAAVNRGYGRSVLVTVDLTTGRIAPVGLLGGPQITGLAVALN